jgi:hypothetical protein
MPAKKPNLNTFMIAMAAAVLAIWCAAALESKLDKTKQQPARELLTVVESHASTSSAFGTTFGAIEGTVRNNSAQTLSHARIDINLYDAQGAHLGSTFALASNVEAGSLWKFTAPVLEQNATAFKIVSVSGY